MSNSLQPHGLQHTRLSCPSLSPGVRSNSSLLSQWCHPTISSSVTLFSSCPQSFPASSSFLMSWLFASGGQSIGASASPSVLPMNIQGWFLLGNLPWKFSSVQFSRLVVSDSLQSHEPQHARPPCPSPAPEIYSNSGLLSRWCHPAILSCVIPLSSCLQRLPASESFPMSQLFALGGQSTGVSASASFHTKKSQGWSPLEWTGVKN